MLATEPMMVRLPANVVAHLSTCHIKTGSAKRVIHLPAQAQPARSRKCSIRQWKTMSNSKAALPRLIQRPAADGDKWHRAGRYQSIRQAQQAALQRARA